MIKGAIHENKCSKWKHIFDPLHKDYSFIAKLLNPYCIHLNVWTHGITYFNNLYKMYHYLLLSFETLFAFGPGYCDAWGQT